jgi:sulfur carrier protein
MSAEDEAGVTSEMKLQINGDVHDFPQPLPLSLQGLIQQLGMKLDRVAVELNRDIVPRESWATTTLSDGDRLEIVHFVGGG